MPPQSDLFAEAGFKQEYLVVLSIFRAQTQRKNSPQICEEAQYTLDLKEKLLSCRIVFHYKD